MMYNALLHKNHNIIVCLMFILYSLYNSDYDLRVTDERNTYTIIV